VTDTIYLFEQGLRPIPFTFIAYNNGPQKLDRAIRWMLACKNAKGGDKKMGNIRRRHNGAFKAKVALESAKAEKTISEISSEYGVHPSQVEMATEN